MASSPTIRRENKNVKLFNFEAPIELMERFDRMADFMETNRTHILLSLIKTFTDLFEERSTRWFNQYNKKMKQNNTGTVLMQEVG